MEFNNTNRNTIAEATTSVASASTPSVEKVVLKSTERATVGSIPSNLKVDVKNNDSVSVLVTHDSKDLMGSFDKNKVKTSLVNIYGKDGKLHTSSRDLESAVIPLSQFPARLEYDLVVVENGVEVQYKTDHLISSTPSNTLVTLTGKSTSSQSEVTLKEAITAIDDDLVKIKNNLQNFSYIYDVDSKKVLDLHNYLININTKLNNIAKDIEDVKEKTKGL